MTSRRASGLLLVAGALCVGSVAVVVRRAHHSLQTAEDSVRRKADLPFDLHTLPPSNGPGFEPISTGGFERAIVAEDAIYVSGPAGIVSYAADGAVLRRWLPGIDLPPSPVRALAVAHLRNLPGPTVVAATATEGLILLANQGRSVQWLRPADPTLRELTALLPLPGGDLLLGTRTRGVLVFSGDSLRSFHPQLDGLQVTALAADTGGAGFWVGTRSAGLVHWSAGTATTFLSDLPDPDVESLTVRGPRVFAGTPLGVREFVDGRPARLLAPETFASALLPSAHDLLVASVDQGTRDLPLDPASHPRLLSSAMPPGDIRAFASAPDGAALAITRDAVLRRDDRGHWSDLLHAPAAPLTDGNISALATDADGRLWVGYFDRGLDILDRGRTTHLEDDHLFCINRLVLDATRGVMLAATANGLVVFDRAGRVQQVLRRRDGLISDHVNDVSFHPGGLTVATSAGLTFLDAGAAPESLYAFQGLVNNHVYALGAQADGATMAGTLGGLSLVQAGRVTRNLTASNSALKHNWITAVSPAPAGGWTVGTYGGGVLEVSATGSVSSPTPAFVVNPNAMLRTQQHLLVGTLSDGLWVESLATGRWTQLTAGLPSRNVTAFAEHDGALSIGTDAGLVTLPERNLP